MQILSSVCSPLSKYFSLSSPPWHPVNSGLSLSHLASNALQFILCVATRLIVLQFKSDHVAIYTHYFISFLSTFVRKPLWSGTYLHPWARLPLSLLNYLFPTLIKLLAVSKTGQAVSHLKISTWAAPYSQIYILFSACPSSSWYSLIPVDRNPGMGRTICMRFLWELRWF